MQDIIFFWKEKFLLKALKQVVLEKSLLTVAAGVEEERDG